MKIISCEPAWRAGNGRYKEIARFHVEISPDIRMFSLRLLEEPGGQRLVHAPEYSRGRCATFSPELARALTALASEALNAMEGTKAHENITAN